MRIFRVLIAVLGILLAGCTATHEIDIKDYRLKLVPRSDIVEVIGKDEGSPLVKHWASGDFLVVEFYTPVDLTDLKTRSSYTVLPVMQFCEQPRLPVILGIGQVYHDGESVTDIRINDHLGNTTDLESEDGLYKYDIVVFLAWEKLRELPISDRELYGREYYAKYDLRSNPIAICIQLGGGNYVDRIDSNQIILEKPDIKRAIARE